MQMNPATSDDDDTHTLPEEGEEALEGTEGDQEDLDGEDHYLPLLAAPVGGGGRTKPPLEHLPPGVHELEDGSLIPLFDVGTRVVVERMILWDPERWLDTRVGKVTMIDDETGVFRVCDEEEKMYFHYAFNDPSTCTVKLAPERGNPFEVPGEGTFRRRRRRVKRKGRRG